MGEKEENPIHLDPTDFESYDLEITIENQTTKTELGNGARKYGSEVGGYVGEDLSISLVQMVDDQLTLDLPPKCCAENHKLSIRIGVKGRGVDSVFPFAASVVSIDKTPTERESVHLKIVGRDKSGWVSFREIFESRQNEIDDFLKAAKG